MGMTDTVKRDQKLRRKEGEKIRNLEKIKFEMGQGCLFRGSYSKFVQAGYHNCS